MGAGWLAGTSSSQRATLATSTGLRNIGLALLYAEFNFPARPEVELGIAAYSALMLLPNFVFAMSMRFRRARAAT